MLLSIPISSFLIFVFFITTIVLFAKIWSKFNKEPFTGGVVGMLIGSILVFLLIMLRQHVYVAHGNSNYTHYVSYGKSSYTLENGNSVELLGSISNAYLINDSDEKLFLEEVVYGIGSWGETIEIAPRSHQPLNQSYLDYFFTENTPPEEISNNSEYVVRLWLRLGKE